MIPKFRVWDNTGEGKMYPVQSLKINSDGSMTVNAPFLSNPICVSGKWQTGYLMQCIGMQDKNKLDIYTGDIVARKNQTIYKVIYCMDRAQFELRRIPDQFPVYFTELSAWEEKVCVVGNIYEAGFAGIRKKVMCVFCHGCD